MLPRAAWLLAAIGATTLALALQNGDVTRATAPWTWSPLPKTAFGALPSIGRPGSGTSGDGLADARSQSSAPLSGPSSTTPAADASNGSADTALSGPAATSLPWAARSRRDGEGPVADETTTVRGAAVTVRGGAAVTVRGGGTDAPPVTAAVATPTLSPIPVPAAVRPPKGPTHVVATGDNLWTIARRHTADIASILRWNEGVDPDRLVAGQRILVPGGAKMKALAKPVAQPARTTPGAATVQRASNPRTSAPQAQDGDHLWPLPVRGTLTRRFSSAHPGIDIAAPQGTRVRAVAGGTVVWSGWKNNGGGYVVEIEHPNGMRSTYNHNSKLTVERGDQVAEGDTVALVGSTGNSTGPHLDLRIQMGGRLIDPLGLY